MSQLIQNPEKILQRLDWTVIRRLDGLLQGDYRTLFHGCGLDLADLRQYQYFDDIRYIDWNVTARMHTPYVRQYFEDREVTAWFLLDLSPSVDFGTVNMLKRDMLTEFSALLARLLTRRGNRVGAIFYTGKVERIIPPGGGRNQVLRLIKDLLQQPQLERSPMTDLAELLEVGVCSIRRRSQVFLISDFISRPGWNKALYILSQRHEVLAAWLFDPREMALPDIGQIVMEDAETGEQLHLDTHDRNFRRRFIEAVQRREYDLNTLFGKLGIDMIKLGTGDDLLTALLQFVALRKQRKKSPASYARANNQRSPFTAERSAGERLMN